MQKDNQQKRKQKEPKHGQNNTRTILLARNYKQTEEFPAQPNFYFDVAITKMTICSRSDKIPRIATISKTCS